MVAQSPTDETPATPAARRWLNVPQWVWEILLVAAIYLLYEFGRGLHQGTPADADHVGRTLLHWESVVHLDPERWLSNGLDGITVLAVPAAYFYATMHYIITPVVLVWLYIRHRHEYVRGRTWLAISTLISLIIFYLVPTAPPRLLGKGFPDVLDDVRQYGWWGGEGSAPRGLGSLTNQFAAMPSMHVGWALWCGYMIYRNAPTRWVRALGVLYPLVTTLVVLSTGNHYLLDTIAGAIVMAVGAGLTWCLFQVRGKIQVRRAESVARNSAGSRELESAASESDDPAAQKSLRTTSG